MTKKIIVLIFGIIVFSIVIYSANAVISFAEEKKLLLEPERYPPEERMNRMTIVGRLFLIDTPEKLKGRLVLKTSVGDTCYLIEGKLEEELRNKLLEIGKRKVVLTGRPLKKKKVIIDIKRDYDSYGQIEKTYKEVSEYERFEVEYMDEIGKEIEITKPHPKIVPLSLDDLRSLEKTPLPPVLREIKGRVIASTLGQPHAPISTIEVETKNLDAQKITTLTFVVTKETRVIKVLGKDNILNLSPSGIKRGDTVDLWFEEKDNLSYARFITITKE